MLRSRCFGWATGAALAAALAGDPASAAFSITLSGGTLTLEQTADHGAVVVWHENGVFRVQEGGGGFATAGAAENLVVEPLDASGSSLELKLDEPVAGSVRPPRTASP